MAHFAKVLNGIVENIIVAEQEFMDTFIDDSPGEWIQTSYNTKEGAEGHYLRDGIKQKRRYFTTNIPYDFEWKTYLGLNQDVYAACKNKTNAMMHYENHGFSESRKYKLKDVIIFSFKYIS